jgi:hypothetical protein
VQVLQDEAEYDGDIILANLVKLQLVVEQTHRAQMPSMDGANRKLPVTYIDTLLSQAQRIKDGLPPAQKNDSALSISR